MTETVTLALKGRWVQLGTDPWHPVLLSLPSTERVGCRLTQLRTTWVEVELGDEQIADLRDILNAMAAKGHSNEGAGRILHISSCQLCMWRGRRVNCCTHPDATASYRSLLKNRDIPDWCPLPKADKAEASQ